MIFSYNFVDFRAENNDNINMASQKQSKLSTEQVLPNSVLDQNAEALELYKETADILKETTDVLEQMAIALGKKRTYIYRSNSTKNCEINHHAISLTTESYKI